MSKKLTIEEFINRSSTKHDGFYDYKDVIYKDNSTKVINNCPVHGKFEQKPNDHLRGIGCTKCARSRISKNQKKSKEQFIKEAIIKHDNFYQYPNIEYKSNKAKVSIECPIHGEFKQTPNAHLQGQGCSKCGKESHWSRSEYIKKAKGRICTFYTIKCFNEEEEFYKIGITMHSTTERYRKALDMPYNYEIISEIQGEAGFIWDLELLEKRKLKELKYSPLLKFGGSKTECFTQYKI